MRKKTEDAKSVIDRDDDGTTRGELAAIVARLGSGTGEELASMYPENDRQSGARRYVRGPDVQIKAILAHDWIVRFELAVWLVLNAARGSLRHRAHARPRVRRNRWAPAQHPYRRRGIGNAQERFDTVPTVANAAQGSADCFDHNRH